MKIPCQLKELSLKFSSIFTRSLSPAEKQNPSDFTRQSKLTLPRIILFILHLVGGGKTAGVDVQAGLFFNSARRSGLWPDAHCVHRSTVSKSRAKIPWTVFESILKKAVAIAYEAWTDRKEDNWHGMSVLAIDGAKYTLPATESIRKEFDPESGLDWPGKGHFPQCLVSTLFDVFRRIPLARTIAPYKGNEREEALKLLPSAPENSIVIMDRGYPSFGLLRYLQREFHGKFIIRCPASGTFGAVMKFARSGQLQANIAIMPPAPFLEKLNPAQRASIKPLTLRAIRYVCPDGKSVSVLLTNLMDEQDCSAADLEYLYTKRWEVETYYRDEKICMDVETFHGKTPNNVRQELFAAAIVTVIARTMANLSEQEHEMPHHKCQAKNAVITIAYEAAILAPECPEIAVEMFQEVLKRIASVKYYKQKQRKPYPRINKSKKNKWKVNRKNDTP